MKTLSTGGYMSDKTQQGGKAAGMIVYEVDAETGKMTVVEIIPAEGMGCADATPANKELTVKDFTRISSAIMATLEDVSKELGKPISSANMIRVFHVLEALARGEV